MKPTVTLLLMISLVSFSYAQHNEQLNSEELSSVSIRMSYISLGYRGYGGYLSLINIESHKVYQSTSKIGFRSYIVVEDLPFGEYDVVFLDVITGGPYVLLDDKALFNRISIAEQKKYYLGNYLTKKIKPTSKLNVSIVKQKDDPRDKIYKKIGKIDEKWLTKDLDFKQSLFKNNSSTVILRN